MRDRDGGSIAGTDIGCIVACAAELHDVLYVVCSTASTTVCYIEYFRAWMDDDLQPHTGVHVHAVATMMPWWQHPMQMLYPIKRTIRAILTKTLTRIPWTRRSDIRRKPGPMTTRPGHFLTSPLTSVVAEWQNGGRVALDV